MASPQVLVSPLLGVVFDKLTSLIQSKFGVQEQMRKLSEIIDSILQVLTDAEEKQATDTGIQDWLKELKDAAYAAEDVLEEWAFRDQQLAPERVTDSLKELMESFHKLAQRAFDFNLQRGMEQTRPKISPLRETVAVLTEPDVYGRDQDKAELVKLLLDQCPPQHGHPKWRQSQQHEVKEDMLVCPILSMGGLGKTTLAQLVYNDQRVAHHFHVRAWVCVSDDFDLKRLLRAIVACLGGRDSEELESLQGSLQQDLRGKRFLIVLDDVWNEDMEVWSKLKGILAGCGASGSSVIVITRLEIVASMMGTCPPHRLQALSEDDCWSLFKTYAFGPGNEETPSLKAIGKEIAAKSRGLPLAAKALGGLLRSKREVEEWAFRDQQLGPEKVTDSLKELVESFDELAQDMVDFHLQRGMVQMRPKISPLRETVGLVAESDVYGRDEDKAELVKLLLDQCRPRLHPRSNRQSQQHEVKEDMLVCPILGMGGLGKTTLAQLVYNDQRVANHFHVRAWVCVSDDFDLKRLLRAIVACLGGCDYEVLEILQRSLQQGLFGKRFLIALDDVWNEDMEVWSKLKGILAGCGASGSSVIVTTRLETVASMMATCPPHRLQALSEHDCWSVFKTYAFGPGNEETPIGKEIAAKSRGVPLAAKFLGGLLRSKREVEEWAFRDQQLAPEKVTDSLKELMESFDELAEDMVDFGLQRGMVQTRPKISPLRETVGLVTEPQVYGREKEEKELVKLLLDQCRRRLHPRSNRQSQQHEVKEDMLVCPILGMGGLGKTTLAQLVYNDQRVAHHFHVRCWVCVSDDFDLKRLIREIVACLGGRDSEELESLQRCLQQELRGKRFLIVLDDVWNEDMEVWSKLKGILAGCGASGSSVIVTTRLETVASMMGTCPPHRLRALSEDDCWSLFKTCAFGPGNEETPSLKAIGKEIVAKCGGLPLAVKSLGGLLRFKGEVYEWLAVKESKIWELPENGLLPALTLSYQNLPSVLKQCFVYCSIFPLDHKINRIELIRLWLANGLVQPSARLELEDVGNEAFHALLSRSFFQDAEKDEDGSILTCKMHDLIHDLACSMAKDECSMVDFENARISPESRDRHVSLFFKQRPSSLTLGFAQSSSSSLRSLIWLDNYRLTRENCHSIFSNLIRLRALDLHKCLIEVVPDCIAEMIHLRYLNLSCTFIKSLPNSICGLNNIQTLILKRCSQLHSLPEDMRKMSSLRHLDIRECNRLSSMPSGLGQLHCLKTFKCFHCEPRGWMQYK